MSRSTSLSELNNLDASVVGVTCRLLVQVSYDESLDLVEKFFLNANQVLSLNEDDTLFQEDY